jgi:hypothetical protein
MFMDGNLSYAIQEPSKYTIYISKLAISLSAFCRF